MDDSYSCAELARDCDWSAIGLGPRDSWSPALEIVVQLVLDSAVPMAYCHAPDFPVVYNDGMAAILGTKHPSGWGRPIAEMVPEIWYQPGMQDMFHRVVHTGAPFLEDDSWFALQRSPQNTADEGYFVRGYSPVREADGRVIGLLVTAVETTNAIDRIQDVASMATTLAAAVTVDDVAKAVLRHVTRHHKFEQVGVCLEDKRNGGWRTTYRRRSDIYTDSEERLPPIWSRASPGDRELLMAEVAETGMAVVTDHGSSVVLPLLGDSKFGAVAFGHGNLSVRDADRATLAAYAELISVAVARALLFEAQRGTADLLQRTLLPHTIPQPPGLNLAVRYQPVSATATAGGDFYDAFLLPDGRLAFAIGDVVGRGMSAATVMGQVRAALRGAALTRPEPQAIFDSLDLLVRSLDHAWPRGTGADHESTVLLADPGFGGELFVTALLGVLDPGTGQLALCSAGHFPPAILRGAGQPDSTPREVLFTDLRTGAPLGLPGPRPVAHLMLDEGDALLAFTDGLIERRHRDLAQGEADLLASLRTVESAGARGICEHVTAQFSDDAGFEDDYAMLAIVRTRHTHRTASVVVPPVPSAVTHARHWAQQQLETWDVNGDPAFATVVGVSELVTNALLHAGTASKVVLDLGHERLLVTVSDTGTRGAPVRSALEPAAARGRGLALVDAISHASGFESSVAGSTVWFEVLLDDQSG